MIEIPRAALTADEIAKRRRVLQLRHQRPDPDDVRLQPRRRRGRVPAQVRRGQDPAGQPVPDARRRRRRADEDRRRQGPRDHARTSRSASAASTAATPSRSPSATRSGSTTCPARRSACRCAGWRRPRRAPDLGGRSGTSASRSVPPTDGRRRPVVSRRRRPGAGRRRGASRSNASSTSSRPIRRSTRRSTGSRPSRKSRA